MKFVEKRYTDAEKFRTVPAKYFFPSKRIEALIETFGGGGKLSRETCIKFLRKRGKITEEELELSKSENSLETRKRLIENSMNFTFGRERFAEGRFNTSEFAALYTAKTVETSKREYRHVLNTLNIQSAEVVVFSLAFSGSAADYRPVWSAGDSTTMPEEHTECRSKAMDAQSEYDAIVAPSMRDTNGSCCAIFNRDCALPHVVHEVVLI